MVPRSFVRFFFSFFLLRGFKVLLGVLGFLRGLGFLGVEGFRHLGFRGLGV